MSIQIFPDLESLSLAAAEFIVAEIADAKGKFKLALAGGNTPKGLYELLAGPQFKSRIDWGKVVVFFGDERWVPPSDPASNEGMARAALLDKVPIPADQVFPMYREGDAEAGAQAYEEILRAHGPLDMALLGMGDDGHTASLFPGIPELEERKRLVVPTVSPKGVAQRLSLAMLALQTTRMLLFLVAGADKHEPFMRAIGDDDRVRPPSGVVANSARSAFWFVDAATVG